MINNPGGNACFGEGISNYSRQTVKKQTNKTPPVTVITATGSSTGHGRTGKSNLTGRDIQSDRGCQLGRRFG